MGSKVYYSKAQALALAKELGVKVSSMVVDPAGTKRYWVGKLAVEYNPKWGGIACWRVDGERIGYVGDAIADAVIREA